MTKLYSPHPVLTAALMLVLLQGPCHAADRSTVTITVDPTTKYAVNGVSEIQPVRSMVVNGASEGRRIDEAAALRMPGTRLYLWTDVDASDEPKGLSNYNLGLPDRIGWLLGHDMDAFVRSQFDRHLTNIDWMSTQYLQLGYLSQWKATKNIVLHVCQPHPRSEDDFAPYAGYYRAVLREVKRRHPELDVRYLMLYNEPNISYLAADDATDRAGRIRLLYGLYKYVSADVRKEFPAVSVVGPSLSQFYKWTDWNDWTVPFLIQVPDASYYGAQIYASRFDELLAWSEMLQAKSIALNGHRIPMVITEWNPQALDGGALPGGSQYWQDKNEVSRVELLAANLFGMMQHPDQFAFTSYFLYDYVHDGYDLLQSHDGVLTPTAGYWFYQTLRDISGERVYAGGDDAESPVKVIAAVNGSRLIVAMHNSNASPQVINLGLLNASVDFMREVKLVRFAYDTTAEKFVQESVGQIKWPKLLTIAGGGTAVLSADLPASVRPSRTLNEQEVFAHETELTIHESAVAVALPAVATSTTKQVYVRAGIYCNDVQAINHIDFRLNGHVMRVAFLPDDREKRQRSVLHIDVPVPGEWLAKYNRLDFSPSAQTAYKLMFASLAVLPRPSSAPPLRVIPAVQEANRVLDLSVRMPREASAGPTVLRVKMANRGAKALDVHAVVTVPKGWTVSTPPASFPVASMGSSTYDYRLTAPDNKRREACTVKVVARAAGIADQTGECSIVYQPRLAANRVPLPPTMDGSLQGWPGSPLVLDHPAMPGGAPYRTATWLAWDDARLYVMVRVSGRQLMAVPAGAVPWGRDTLEMFLDFTNAKNSTRDLRSIQTVMILAQGDTGKPDWYNAPTNAAGELVANVKPASYAMHVNRDADGFVVQASLDWTSLDAASGLPTERRFCPMPDEKIGFELSLAGESVIGGGTANGVWSNPSEWGTLTLVDPTAPVHIDFACVDANSAGRLNIPPAYMIKDGVLRIPSIDGGGLSVTLNGNAPSPVEELGVTTTIAFGGFVSTATGDASGYVQSIRAFWTPRTLTGFLEPFAMHGPLLCLVAEYSKRTGATTFTFNRKDTGEGNGFGTALWSGKLAASDFPITAKITLEQSSYHLIFDKHIETISGNLSGATSWSAAEWSAPMRFGVHAVNQSGTPGAVLIRSLSIEPAQ